METTAPNAAKPNAKRRWFQFGLRTLLILVTLACCGLGWFGTKIHKARRQQAATMVINQANQALADLRVGRFEGAAVLVP
jgi:hypothetical protein